MVIPGQKVRNWSITDADMPVCSLFWNSGNIPADTDNPAKRAYPIVYFYSTGTESQGVLDARSLLVQGSST